MSSDTPLEFDVVPDALRDEVGKRPIYGRGRMGPLVKALLAGKTIKISKDERDRIGGNAKTLRNHGMRMRSGLINDTDVVIWAEPLDGTE